MFLRNVWALSYSCGPWVCNTEGCPDQRAFTMVLSLPCCAVLYFHIFSVSAYSHWSKPCSVLLIFFQLVTVIVTLISICLSDRALCLSDPPLTARFLCLSSLFNSFWGVFRQVVIYTTRSFRVESCILTPSSTPSALLHIRPGVAFSVGRHKWQDWKMKWAGSILQTLFEVLIPVYVSCRPHQTSSSWQVREMLLWRKHGLIFNKSFLWI